CENTGGIEQRGEDRRSGIASRSHRAACACGRTVMHRTNRVVAVTARALDRTCRSREPEQHGRSDEPCHLADEPCGRDRAQQATRPRHKRRSQYLRCFVVSNDTCDNTAIPCRRSHKRKYKRSAQCGSRVRVKGSSSFAIASWIPAVTPS